MASEGSVTRWLGPLKAGDPQAAQQLWERYFRRLVGLARRKLRGAKRQAADEEDVALSAFDSFCRAAEQGRFPQLNDREDLWQLLIVLSDRKACDLIQFEHRQRRGGGRVLDEAALDGRDSSAGYALGQLAAQEPTPEMTAQVAEECRRLLDVLGDAELQRVALRKMEGYTVEEIATELGSVPRTVKRRLQLIRRIWQDESEGRA